MKSYSDLTLAQRIQYAKDVTLTKYSAHQPSSTLQNKFNLNQAIAGTSRNLVGIKNSISKLSKQLGKSAYTTPIPFSRLPGHLQSQMKQYIPPGYAPPATITGNEIVGVNQGVVDGLVTLQKNSSTLPAAGANTVNTVEPSTATPAIRTSRTPTRTTNPSNSPPNFNAIASAIGLGISGAALLVRSGQSARPAATPPIARGKVTDTGDETARLLNRAPEMVTVQNQETGEFYQVPKTFYNNVIAQQNPPTQSLTPEQQRFLEANQEPQGLPLETVPPVQVGTLTPEQQRFLEANQADAGTIESQRVLTPAEQQFLEANQEPQGLPLKTIPPVQVDTLTPEQQRFLEANQADAGTLQVQKVLTPEEQKFLEANQEPQGVLLETVPPVQVDTLTPEQQRFLEANQADAGTLQAQKVPSIEEQKFLDANAEPASTIPNPPVVSPAEADALAINQANPAGLPVVTPPATVDVPSIAAADQAAINAAAETKVQNPTQINPNTDPEQQKFLEANAAPDGQGLETAPSVQVDTLTPEQQKFLEANQADAGTIEAQRVPSPEEQRFLEANAEPTNIQQVIDAEQDPFEKSRLEAELAAEQAQQPTAQEIIDSEQDPFEKARLEAELAANKAEQPTTQQIIDSEQDPFEKARLEAELAANETSQPTAQEIIDSEQDPFEKARLEAELRSNEDSQPTAQEIIDSEQDPFEKARLQRELDDNERQQPTEQEVIDSEQDPFEKARLQKEFDANNKAQPTDQEVIDSEQDPFEKSRLEAEKKLNDDEANLRENPPTVDTNEDPGANGGDGGGGEDTGEESENPGSTGSSKGLEGAKGRARAQVTSQDLQKLKQLADWRVKLQLSPGAYYLYMSDDPGIMQPLQETNGIIFPYTPQISANYVANYDPTDLVHSNYKVYAYKNSAVDNISINAEFTAQDTYEARYMLAVIHFFRSITKMFYGQDQNPQNGFPPPMVFLSGLGPFQFNNHPLVITQFNYSLPNDVDYIRAMPANWVPVPGQSTQSSNPRTNESNPTLNRTKSSRIAPGGEPIGPIFKVSGENDYTYPLNDQGPNMKPTYVPTRMAMQISAVPVISRNKVSNEFSLRDYGNGYLYGNKGFW